MTSKSTSAISSSGSAISSVSSTSGSGGDSVGASVALEHALMIMAIITRTPTTVHNLLFLNIGSSP
jgi:hypothetical protein